MWLIVAIIVFFIFDVVITIWILMRRKRGRSLQQLQLNYIQSHWVRIIDSFGADQKHAIMDADKLLDYALKCHGFEGHLGEKLKKAGPRFSDLNGTWSAHKLRNEIAHELGDIDKSRSKTALAQFKRALNDLGARL